MHCCKKIRHLHIQVPNFILDLAKCKAILCHNASLLEKYLLRFISSPINRDQDKIHRVLFWSLLFFLKVD